MKWTAISAFALAACQPPEVVKADLCNAPFPPKWQRADAPCELCEYNTIEIGTDGSILWNGTTVDRVTLEKYIGLTRKMDPEPVTTLDFTRGVPCEPVRYVRQTMDKLLECKDGYKCRVGKLKPMPF